MCGTFQMTVDLLLTLGMRNNWYELISGTFRDSGNPFSCHYHNALGKKSKAMLPWMGLSRTSGRYIHHSPPC